MLKRLLLGIVTGCAIPAAAWAMPIAAPETANPVQTVQSPIWYQNGQQCQVSSMGVTVCRPIERRRRWGGGYGGGYYGEGSGYNPNPVWYRNGQQCQVSSMGVTVCRPAYGYGRRYGPY